MAILFGLTASAFAFTGSAGASSHSVITVRTGSLEVGEVGLLSIPAGPSVVNLATDSFAENKAAIQALVPGAERTVLLPATVVGFDALTIEIQVADVLFDDDTRSAALPGTFTFNGAGVDGLLLIQWFDDDSAIPNVSIGLHASDIDLEAFTTAWALEAGAPAPAFPDTWVALATGEQDLSPFTEADLPTTPLISFYPDGFAIADFGVVFQSTLVLDSAIGAAATEALGYVPEGGASPATLATLTGDLGTTWDIFNGDFTDASLSLLATLPPAPGAVIGGWLQASDDWELTFDHTVGAPPVAVGLTGQLAPAAGSPVDGDFPPFDVVGSFEYDAGDVSVALNGTFVDDQCAAANPGVFVPTAPPALVPPRAACWENAVGYDWLDLYGVSIGTEFAIVAGAAEATVTLNASLDADNADGPLAGFDMEALFSFEPGVLGADFTISTEIGMDEIAALFEAQGTTTSKTGVAELFPGQDTLRLNQVRFSASTNLGEEATFTMTANATVLDSVDVEVLIGLTNVFQDGADRQLLLLGVKTTDVTFSALFEKTTPSLAGSVLGELSMPGVDYTVAIPLDDTAAPPYTITADDLSQAALDFYNQGVVDLHLEGELSIEGTADLAVLGDDFLDTFGFVKDGLGQSLVDYTGAMSATFDWGDGNGAAFELTGLELTAALPTIEITFPDWLDRQPPSPGATVDDLFLRFEYDGASYLGELRSTVTANIDDNGPDESIAVAVGLTYDAPAFGFSMAGDIGKSWDTEGDITGDGIWVDPFGIGVDATDAFIGFEFDSGPPLSSSATIGASIPVSTAMLTATAEVAVEGGSVSADFRGELDGSIPLDEIVDFAAGPLGEVPSVAGTGLENLSIDDVTLAFHVGDDPTFLATGTTIYDGTIAADALFSAAYDSGALEYATALRLHPVGDLTIGDLDDDFPAPFTDVFISPFGDFALPDVTLVVANADIDVASADLDPAMFDFFKHLYGCEETDTQLDCDFTLEIAQGATALASVGLPDGIDDVVVDLWIDPDAEVLLKGFVPLFGSTVEPRFEAAFPEITPPTGAAPQWFVSGQLSFFITPSAFGLEGKMTVLMDGEQLAFALGGELDAGPPTSLTLSGDLITERTWESVFGIGWLDINALRIELGIGAGVTIGFRGDVVIADKDLDASLLVQILPGGIPNLLGVRGASQAGYSLIDLATFQAQVAAAGSGVPINIAQLTAALPNMTLKSVEFSYSSVSRPELCLEPGIILGGDLYINPLGSAAGAPVGGGGCEQILPRPSPSTYCIYHRIDGCFISARMEIDPNGIVAYGSLPGFNIGPDIVIIGDAGVDLTVNSSEQSLRVFGSATIPNVTTGDLDMTITPTGREFKGDFKIFGAFFAYIDAEMTTVSPTAPFNFDEASFHVEAVMRGDFTSAVQAAVEPFMVEIRRIFDVVNPLWTSVTTINATNALGVIAAVPEQLQAVGIPAPQFLTDIATVVGSIQGLIDVAVDLFEEIPGFDLASLGLPTSPLEFANLALNGFNLPGFPGVSIPYVPETCITTWVGSSCFSVPPTDNVYATVCAPWPFDDECASILVFPALPGIPGVVVPPICLGVEVGGTCYLLGLVPVTLPGIPGLCDAIPGAVVGVNRTWVGAGTPECSVQGLVQGAVRPLVEGLLGDTIGIPSVPPIQTALNNLSTVFSDSGTLFSLDCAAFTAEIAGLKGSKVVGLDIAVTALGNNFGLTTSFDFNDPAGSAFSLFKNLLTGVIFNIPRNALCAGQAPGQVILPPRNLVLTGATTISENQSAAMGGTFVSDDAGPHTLTIDWRDGPKQVVTLGAGVRSFNLSHSYPDDNPTATAANIYLTTIKVDSPATGSASATRPITVNNVAPHSLSMTATPSITENGFVTVSGSFIDPGTQDTHRVVINWGDGTPTVIDLGGQRSFAASHQYRDDNPTASASNVYTIGVSVIDDDTGSAGTTRQTTVFNDAPDVVVNYFQTSSIDPVVSTPGRIIDEGGWITVQGSFVDAGSLDTHQVVIDWKDGSPTIINLPVGVRTFEARHRYLDDDPTATIQDFYDVVVTVTDDDTQAASDTQRVTVNNVTPFDVTLSFGLLAVDENETITVNGSFIDPGLEDSHVVEINWGDGTPSDLLTLPVGAREFLFEHQYLDDDPTATPLDSYTLSVLFYDDDDTITRPVDPTDMTTKFKKLLLDASGLPIPVNPGAPAEELEYRTIEITRLGSEGPPVANVRNVPQEVDFVITGDLSIDVGDTVMARILENGSISLEGWFIDPGTLDPHTVCIDWGDARTFDGPVVPAPTDFASCIDDEGSYWVTRIDIAADPQRTFDAPRLFSASHQYLDDNPTASDTNVYRVTVWTRDDDTGEGTANHSVRVDNVTPELEFDLTPKDSDLDGVWDGLPRQPENEVIRLTGSFIDEGTRDAWTIVIDWGDGTFESIDVVEMTLGAVTREPADGALISASVEDVTVDSDVIGVKWSFVVDHQYIDDNPTVSVFDIYTVTVRVTDDDTEYDEKSDDLRIDNVLPVIEAGNDRFVFEDDLMSLEAAVFGDRGTADTHSASIDWGDYSEVDLVRVTEFAGAVGDPAGADGTLDTLHRYREPGIYQATVCIVDDDEPHNPVCDTFVVTVVNSFLKFAGFGNAYLAEVDADASITGSFGGNAEVKLDSDVVVTGDAVSVSGDVDVEDRTRVGGRIVAGHDVDVDMNSVVVGTVDADRNVDVDDSSTTGPVTIGPIAYDFPEVRWVDLDFVGGTNDLKTTGTTRLPSGTYGDVEVYRGTLVLGPGVYRFESLKTKTGTKVVLDLDAGETIVIEVAGDVGFYKDTSLVIDGTAGPSDVLVLVGDGKVELGEGGSFVGTFISDDRAVKLGKNARLVGALYGRSVKFEDDTTVTADPALQLFADHRLVLDAVDTVLITIDAGLDQFVFEDTLIDLDPALFWSRDEPVDHSATIDWGDGTTPGLVTVTPVDLAYNEPDGTIQASHVYAQPGEYVVSVCAFSATEPACQLDTFVVTVVPGFLRLATFSYSGPTFIAQGATVIGSVGANGRVDLVDRAAVSGDMVSVSNDVVLQGHATVGGDVIAGRDASIHKDAAVTGDLDARRRARIYGTVGGDTTIGVTAAIFPALRWADIDFAGGEVDRRTIMTTALAPDIYGDVRVASGTLVLRGGIYRFGSLTAANGTVIEIHLNAGETIVVQVEREVSFSNRVKMRIVGSGSPDDVLILVSDSKISLGDGGTYVGTFISDDGDARLGKNATLRGALYGKRTRIEMGATLTFEPASRLYAAQSIANR